MKNLQRRSHRLAALVGIGTTVLLVIVGFQWRATEAVAAPRASASFASDQATFHSDTALLERSPGTPVGPPKKIIICHNGHTIRVNESAVPSHLAQGDTLGPCSEDAVLCHDGITIMVNQSSVSSRLAHGDKLGPCENNVFMCNLHLRTIVVNANSIEAHQARGHHLGLCPGKSLVCHKGHTIIVLDSAVSDHLAHGDSLGYCLGGSGPLITSNQIPSLVSN